MAISLEVKHYTEGIRMAQFVLSIKYNERPFKLKLPFRVKSKLPTVGKKQ